MRYTRRGFGRRALTFGLAIFCAITLTSVGFAAWVLSNNANIDTNGGIVTETVTDISIKIEITNSDDNKQLYDEVRGEDGQVTKLPQVIAFAPIAPDGSVNDPAHTGQIQNDGKGYSEDLSFTVLGTVDSILKIGSLRFNVRVPESIIKAAGLTRPAKDGDPWLYEPAKAFISLPSYAMDMEGKPIPYVGGKLSTADENGKVQYLFPNDATDGIVEFLPSEDQTWFWTQDIVWENPGDALVGATTSTKISCGLTQDNVSPFEIMPLVKNQSVVEDKLEFAWTIHFGWGARYLGMNPNYFYDVNERVVGKHDTLTLASEYPNQYTIGNMNLVNYDLILMQAVINGLDLDNYYTGRTVAEGEVYVDTGIVLDEENNKTLEDFIKNPANEDSIKNSLAKLQQNIDVAIKHLGNKAPSYGFWIFADVK